MVTGPPCGECGEPITRRWAHELREAQFCRNACKLAYQRKHPTNDKGKRKTVPCDVCGKMFSFHPSVRPTGRYCSRECFGIGHSKMMTGRRPSGGIYANHHVFRIAMRKELIDRCAICGWGEAPNDVCHITARHKGGEDAIENMVMLCPNHHRLFDRGKLTLEAVVAARPNCLPRQSTPASSSSV